MIGARIAALRRRAGLSQSELGLQLGCSGSAVGMYEQGRRQPSAEVLVKLSRLFEVSTDYLLTGQIQHAQDRQAFEQIMERTLGADGLPDAPQGRGFSRQELAVLMAAMLMEP